LLLDSYTPSSTRFRDDGEMGGSFHHRHYTSQHTPLVLKTPNQPGHREIATTGFGLGGKGQRKAKKLRYLYHGFLAFFWLLCFCLRTKDYDTFFTFDFRVGGGRQAKAQHGNAVCFFPSSVACMALDLVSLTHQLVSLLVATVVSSHTCVVRVAKRL